VSRALLLAAAALVAVPAVASAQSVSTDCYSRKGHYHCRSTYHPSVSEIIDRLNRSRAPSSVPHDTGRSIAGERILAERLARGEGPNDPPNHDPGHQLFMVARFLGNQDCPGALRYAAATKNPFTIKRAESFCGKEPSQ